MGGMDSGEVTQILVYPTKGEPGLELREVEVMSDGLEGDRRKRAPVHLVADEESRDVRANFVVSLTGDQLRDLVGKTVTLGGAELGILGAAGSCAGVYAEVRQPGAVHVGDVVS
jgi:hypothetical protein